MQKTLGQFPVPTSGGPQLPITIVPGDPMPSSSLCGPRHIISSAYIDTQAHARTLTLTFVYFK